MDSARRRGGYTLLEMLLVLTVLASVAAIAWPTVTRLHDDHQLNRAVEEVRVKLAATRLHALDAGATYQFRFEPGGRRFLVVPREVDQSETAEADSAEAESASFRDAGELPAGLAFRTVEASTLSVEPIPEELLSGLGNAKELAEATWSPPILFFSDGTAHDAALDVVDAKRRSARVSVRGLTGAVTASRTSAGSDS